MRRSAIMVPVLVIVLAPFAARTAGAEAPAHNYRGAAAHDPRFEDKQLWPMLKGKESYAAQAWPKGRLMVWAKPGTSGGRRVRGGINLLDPSNWTEDGKPCRKVVFDENTDIVLPASDTPYQINGREDRGWPDAFRHITVERNAVLGGGGDGKGRKIHGNVWIKPGGGMDAQGATQFLGAGHAFFRNDNTMKTARGTGRGQGIMSSQYFVFNKTDGASVEFLGHVTVLDEFRIHGCTVIVGPDSKLQPGRNAAPSIQQGGVLALMDGAVFESWNNDFGNPEMTVRDGTIQGGMPDRPLLRSCTFGLAFKNYTKAEHKSLDEKQRRRRFVRVPSLVVLSGALRSYTTDPQAARLTFSVMENQHIAPLPGTRNYERSVQRRPENKALFAWMMELPHGTDVFLGPDVAVENVEFDHLRKGGLMMADPSKRGGWRNVSFGPNCAGGDADVLISPTKSLDRNMQY